MKILLLPKDKNDERNCTLEIRAGAGGEEGGTQKPLRKFFVSRVNFFEFGKHASKTDFHDAFYAVEIFHHPGSN